LGAAFSFQIAKQIAKTASMKLPARLLAKERAPGTLQTTRARTLGVTKYVVSA
jgi:hypothetical protein